MNKTNYKKQDLWKKYRIGSRLMFLTVWVVFCIMSFKILNGQKIDKNFQDMVSNLVLYLTIFIAVGVNGIETIGKIYEKIGIKKFDNTMNNKNINNNDIKR